MNLNFDKDDPVINWSDNESIDRQFIKAVRDNNTSLAVSLIDCGVYLGFVGYDALADASELGNYDLVKVLLDRGVYPNYEALTEAKNGGHWDVFKLLRDKIYGPIGIDYES